MGILRTCVASAAIAAIATTSVAGGLADQIMEAPVVAEEEMVPAAGPSIDPSLIVLGILALLVLGASSSSDDNSEPVQESCEPRCIIIEQPPITAG